MSLLKAYLNTCAFDLNQFESQRLIGVFAKVTR